MTAPDIRERVRDLLTAHEVEASSLGWSCRCGVYGAGDYIDHLVDALAAAGLLPTGVEHGAILAGDDDPASWAVGISGDVYAEWAAPKDRLRRAVGPWVREEGE